MKCFAFSEILLGFLRFLFHTLSIANVHFGKIQYFFKVLKTNFEIQYFFNTFNTVWEPCIMFTLVLFVANDIQFERETKKAERNAALYSPFCFVSVTHSQCML